MVRTDQVSEFHEDSIEVSLQISKDRVPMFVNTIIVDCLDRFPYLQPKNVCSRKPDDNGYFKFRCLPRIGPTLIEMAQNLRT